jgi:hypothetical protein
MPGEGTEGEEGGKQHPVRKGPLENNLWSLIEEVEKDKVERGLMFDKDIYLLEEKDDHIDEEKAGQAQAEDLQIFPDDISMKDTVTFKHL